MFLAVANCEINFSETKSLRMYIPYLNNKVKSIQFGSFWIVFALLQAVAFSYLIEIPTWLVLIDSFIHATVYGALSVLLLLTIYYGKFETLTIFQRIINYLALATLTIGLWIWVSYAFSELFIGESYTRLFNSTLPLRGFIGLLVFLIVTEHFYNKREITADSITVYNTNGLETSLPVNEQNTEREILERITVKSGTKIHVILIPDIVYLQADGDYVQIITTDGKYLKEQTMKYFDEHLASSLFVRVHRSYIVNVEMISRIELYEKQNQLLTLKNGHQIKTSPGGYKTLKGVLNL